MRTIGILIIRHTGAELFNAVYELTRPSAHMSTYTALSPMSVTSDVQTTVSTLDGVLWTAIFTELVL